jgi:N6-adenosine-specific RNA methylase IME4
MPIFNWWDWEKGLDMDIITQANNLPTKIEDLSRFVLVGREKMVSVRAEIRAIDKLGLGKEVRQQKLDEGQMIADALLDAEVRLGELMREIPKATKWDTAGNQKDNGVHLTTKAEELKSIGFNEKQKQRFEKLAAHPEIVAQAKAEARQNDDMVSRSFVLEKIKAKEKETKADERREELQNPTRLPDGVFQVVYCDPPWQYNNSGFNSSAEQHYPTMSMDELMAMPVKNMRADNAVMFMWATNPLLKEAIELMETWGFEYKTNIAWVKDRQINLGFYVYGKHELLLIGTNGSMLPIGDKPSSVMTASNNIHSKKPESTYELIEAMYPRLKYVELFARNTPRNGWVKWGNEVGKYE